jgi:hypothetical protein
MDLEKKEQTEKDISTIEKDITNLKLLVENIDEHINYTLKASINQQTIIDKILLLETNKKSIEEMREKRREIESSSLKEDLNKSIEKDLAKKMIESKNKELNLLKKERKKLKKRARRRKNKLKTLIKINE